MSCYVNPHGRDKEDFLLRHGQRVQPDGAVIEPQRLPVCLVDGGIASVAMVAYTPELLAKYKEDDGRYKQWYMCWKSDLRMVSDLARYEI